jgi:hypothetical protein
MSQVEEQRPGWIEVEVSAGGVLLGQVRQPVKVLGANQWLRSSALVSTELLAAFVMPNHPAVGALLADASARLQVRTASGSLEGYQSGEQRVDDIVHAIFEASAAHGVRYAEPPASWTDAGHGQGAGVEQLDSSRGIQRPDPDELLVGDVEALAFGAPGWH